jgi:hypothetical protein
MDDDTVVADAESRLLDRHFVEAVAEAERRRPGIPITAAVLNATVHPSRDEEEFHAVG